MEIQELKNRIKELEKENEDMREELQMYVDTDVMILQKELKDSINARFELQRRIDKLLKENETLKENNLSYQQELAKAWKENEELKRKTYKAYINDKGEIQFVFDNYISKDKIRTEIKELEEILEKRKTIDVIEEINRLEELLEDDE